MPAACGRGYSPLMDYKERPNPDLPNDASLPDELNAFHAHFNNNIVLGVRAVPDLVDWMILLTEADVKNVFNQINTHKTVGPDGIPGRVLRACTEQLADIFTVIFNISLSQSVIPTCLR
jgi:hypothetical protein